MKDLVEAQFIGSKNDIEKLNAIVGINTVFIEEFIRNKASLMDEITRLESELKIVSHELDDLKTKTPIYIHNAIYEHERDMPHNDSTPNQRILKLKEGGIIERLG